jgi:hypothetical protein
MMELTPLPLIPTKAGIHSIAVDVYGALSETSAPWIPAFAGMSGIK